MFWETIRPNSKKIVFLVFPQKKLVFGGKINSFLGKIWFLAKKPIFFLGKTKINYLWGNYTTKLQKGVGFQWKNQLNQLFPGKMMVLNQKPIFSLGKCGFQWKNRPFPRKKMVLGQNHLLPRKELVFQSKTRFFLGKVCASLLFPYTSFLFVRV